MSYIAIVDYGAGNLMSVHNSLDFLGYDNKIASTLDDLADASGVILPGVGAFPDAMQALKDSGLLEAVLDLSLIHILIFRKGEILRRVPQEELVDALMDEIAKYEA